MGETMVDFSDLLRQIQQDGLSAKSLGRIKHALNEGGIGQLGGQLREALGGVASRQSTVDGGGSGGPLSGMDVFGTGAGDMLDKAKDLLAKRDKRMIGGVGAALGVLLGGGVKGGIGGALMAILGTAAYDALNKGKTIQDMMAGRREQDLPVSMRPPETEAEAEDLENRALLALKAMIAASKADGRIDERERGRILDKMTDMGASDEMRDFIAKEAATVLDVDALVREVPDEQAAAQVYAASLLAINADSPAEKAYLQELASKLGLNDAVVASLHNVLGAPTIA